MAQLQKRSGGVEMALTEALKQVKNERTRGEYQRDVAQYIGHIRGTGEALAEV